MKQLLLSFAIASLAFTNMQAATGGPDTYGYTWVDSNEPNGPTYTWWDISQIGNPVTGLADDNIIGPKPIGGNFQYYWYQVDKVWIGSNGYIAFNNGNLAAPFPIIPTAGGVNDYIAALASDLNFLGVNNPAQCYYYANADSFCVSWVNVPYWYSSNPSYQGSNSFQIILNKSDSTITVNYQSCTSQLTSFEDISAGIENNSGQIGLQSFTDVFPAANYTVKFFAPRNPSLQVNEGAPMWNTAVGNNGYFLKRNGSPVSVTTNVKNLGNTTLAPFPVVTDVLSINNTLQVSNSDSTGTLAPGQDTSFVFTNPWNTTLAGTFKIVSTVSGIPNDYNTLNNTKTQEVVVIDTTQTTMTMNYNVNFTNQIGTSVGWNGGAGGVGMFFKPPVYPARVTATKFIITGSPQLPTSFYAKIYDDNGPGGSPGTLLDSVAVQTSSVILNGVTTVNTASNVVIASGGIYVLWDMAGVGSTLAEDLTPPFSLNTYEVFNNFWAEYRDREVKDFFIGVDFKYAFPEDVGAIRIVSPLNNATIATGVQVRAYIKNFAANPDNYAINVNYKLGLSGNTITQQYLGPVINPGDSVLFTFTQLLYPQYSGQDNLCVWTSKNTDINNMNDSTCINVTLVGINEYNLLQHRVSIYPVPATNAVNFKFDESINTNTIITILDVLGNVVYSQNYNNISSSEQITINTENFAAGVYSFTIVSDKISSGKISVIK
jgi:hypothetical protein